MNPQDLPREDSAPLLYKMGKSYRGLGKMVAIRSSAIDVAGFNLERLYFFKDKHGVVSMVPQELRLSPK